jgi:hypothetical protein
MFSRQCKLHLEEVNETALEHMYHAIKVAVKLQLLVPVVLIHSIAPRFFTRTASDVMSKILKERNK